MTQLIISGMFHYLVRKNDDILLNGKKYSQRLYGKQPKEIKCLILTSTTVFYALRAEVWNEVTQPFVYTCAVQCEHHSVSFSHIFLSISLRNLPLLKYHLVCCADLYSHLEILLCQLSHFVLVSCKNQLVYTLYLLKCRHHSSSLFYHMARKRS